MSARRTRSSADSLPATPEGKPKRSARALASIIERSSRIQGPLAAAYVDRLRRAAPDAGPATIVAKLEKRYVTAVTANQVGADPLVLARQIVQLFRIELSGKRS